MTVIKFEDVSKRYKLYSKGGLYMRDRLTHALQRFVSPVNGVAKSAGPGANSSPPVSSATPSANVTSPLALGTPHLLERDFWALKNVSFEIKEGESVGFIGRNGAGKSTILKLLAGVTKPSSGIVEVNGKIAAMIEVGAGFHPELTGRENIYLNGSILGMTKAEIEEKFEGIVDYAELQDFIDTPVKHYSSGMYIRLGFAVAAHTNPDIYLIDEVLAVGDEAFQKKCLDTLARHRDEGKSMILVSHNLETVAEICTRCVYVSHGEVCVDDLPNHAIAHYRGDISNQKKIVTTELQARAKILDLVFRDESGNQRIDFTSGRDLIIEIRYSSVSRIENPVFGLAIHGPKGEHITGFNTRTSLQIVDGIEGNGSIFCRLRNLILRRGRYYVSASVSDCESAHLFDYQPPRQYINVSCNDQDTDGLVRFVGEWAMDPAFEEPLDKRELFCLSKTQTRT